MNQELKKYLPSDIINYVISPYLQPSIKEIKVKRKHQYYALNVLFYRYNKESELFYLYRYKTIKEIHPDMTNRLINLICINLKYY